MKEKNNSKFIPGDVIDGILSKLPLKSVIRFKCVSKPWHDLINDFSIDRVHLQLIEFLLKLPPKSLIRFKCVCKSWNDLIGHPSFARAHLQRNRHNTSIVSRRYEDQTMTILDKNTTCDKLILKEFIPMPRINRPSEMVCSCDGILCYISVESKTEIELLLWNPSIRKHKILRIPKRNSLDRDTFAIGYDSSIDDYKLIRISESTSRGMNFIEMVEVMAMKSNQWRRLFYRLRYNSSFYDKKATMVSQHGAVYWFLSTDEIIRFDLATEKFHNESLPKDYGTVGGDVTSLLEVDGKIYLTQYSVFGMNVTKMWIMKDGIWVRLFCWTLTISVDFETSRFIYDERGAFLQTRYNAFYIHGMKRETKRVALPFKNSECRFYNALTCVNSLILP